ncbi:MAG TPA: hypothetical protein VF681_13035 [Abditibacteriaceae bacterium]
MLHRVGDPVVPQNNGLLPRLQNFPQEKSTVDFDRTFRARHIRKAPYKS